MLTVDTFFLNLTLITLAMLVIGGMQSLSGAVVGVVVMTVVIDLLKNLESGMFGKDGFVIPQQHLGGVGVVMMLIIIFRRSGITRTPSSTGRSRATSPRKARSSASPERQTRRLPPQRRRLRRPQIGGTIASRVSKSRRTTQSGRRERPCMLSMAL